MDYFSLFFEGFCLIGQGVLHIAFVCRLTGKRYKPQYFAAYLLLLCVMEWLFIKTGFSGTLAIGVEVCVLYAVSCLMFRNCRSTSWVAAIFAVHISQLSFGIINSAEIMLFPRIVGRPLMYSMLLLATLSAFVICACCYAAALKFLSFTENSQAPFAYLLLFPGMFFFAVEQYILQTSYSVLPVSFSAGEIGKHGALLLLQALGLGALFCTLYAYQRLCCGLQAQAASRVLAHAAQAQKAYIIEAKMRYEQTKAFRHDIKNHLTVLGGLLNSGKWEDSKAYLQKLETVSSSLSFPYQSGNPVVDILLREKLGMAKASGIAIDISLILPQSCGIDDFDLCVIFANALDNAISACQAVQGARLIRISGDRQGDFYMLAFENTCADEPVSAMGTGLSNIKSVAEKYHGAMLTEKGEGHYSLSVLLNISLHPESTSDQKP